MEDVELGYGKFGLSTFYKLYKTMRSVKCDVVHFHLIATYFWFLVLFFDRRKNIL